MIKVNYFHVYFYVFKTINNLYSTLSQKHLDKINQFSVNFGNV